MIPFDPILNGRRLLKNALSLLSLGVMDRAANLVLTVVATHVLSQSIFGAYMLIQALLMVGGLVIHFGLEFVVVRGVTQDRTQASRIFSVTVVAMSILALLSWGGIVAAASLLHHPPTVKRLVTVAGASLLGVALSQASVAMLKALERMEVFAAVKGLLSLLFSAAGITALLSGWGLNVLVTLLFARTLVGGVLLLVLVHRAFVPIVPIRDLGRLGLLFRQAAPIALLTVFSILLRQADVLLLGGLRPLREVALYGAATKIVASLVLVSDSFVGALFPRLSALWENSRRASRRLYERSVSLFSLFGFPIALGASVLGGSVLRWVFGETYGGGGVALALLGWAYLFKILGTPPSLLLIIAADRLRHLLLLAGSVVALNVSLNLLLIPRFGYPAAAGVTLLCAVVNAGVGFRMARHYFQPPVHLLRLIIRPALAALVMSGSLLLLSPWRPPLQILSGGLVYLIALIALRRIDLPWLGKVPSPVIWPDRAEDAPAIWETKADPCPQHLTRAHIGEVLPGVVTPLTWSTFTRSLALGESAEQRIRPSETAVLIEGQAYMDVGRFWRHYSDIPGINPKTVLAKGLGIDLDSTGGDIASIDAAAGGIERLKKAAYVWLCILAWELERSRIRRKLKSRLRSPLAGIRARNLGTAGELAIWQHMERLLELTSEAFLLHMQTSFIALCSYAALRDALAKTVNGAYADRVVSTIGDPGGGVSHREIIEALTDQVRSCPEMVELFRHRSADRLLSALQLHPQGQVLVGELTRQVRSLGDRAVDEFELSAPRWSEDPRPLLAAVQASIVGEVDDGSSPPDLGEGDPPLDVSAQLGSVPLSRRWVLRRMIGAFGAYSRLREETKGLLMSCFAQMRASALAAGERFVTAGLLMEEEDVFFLRLDEIGAVLTGSSDGAEYGLSVAERQATHVGFQVPRGAPDDTSTGGDVALWGTGVSGGRVTGRARVVSSPTEASLNQGEILVTASTDPGWFPLFLTSGGIVTEIGGMLSHTATLARELRKPAVFSVADATRTIRDGQLVTVDGERGEVQIHMEDSLP